MMPHIDAYPKNPLQAFFRTARSAILDLLRNFVARVR